MPIELRILTGARAGQRESFDKPVVTVGRHPTCDMRFDAHQDLEVSTRHGEIRAEDGHYALYDTQSTNGTFVNGERLAPGGMRALHDGDVIGFGANGPTVSVGLSAAPRASTTTEPRRRSKPTTGERIAIAVKQQTRGLRIAVGASILLLGGLAATAFWWGRRGAAARDQELQRVVAEYNEASKTFETRLQSMSDTSVTNGLRRMNDSLLKTARDQRGADAASARRELARNRQTITAAADWAPAVRAANNPGVVLILTDGLAQAVEGTGFSVGGGLIVTNRHMVADSSGKATHIGVKFADSRRWYHAHVARLPEDPETDLALLKIDEPGSFPAVRGIASSVDTPVGGSIATIGFPLGTDLVMEGSGNDFAAKTSLNIGTVSKTTRSLLQIDAFATHGSSGEPVFDVHSHVIGVVYGGPEGGGGRIVYAVPAEAINALVRGGSAK
jgi:S1-C subfamily serine protease